MPPTACRQAVATGVLLLALGMSLLAIAPTPRSLERGKTPQLTWEFGSDERWLDWSGFGSPERTNDLTQLRRHPAAVGLDISFSTISGGGYSELTHLPQLRALIASYDATDEDCVAISQCQQLRQLSIEYTGITDRGISHLTRLSHLQYLRLPNSVTDAAIEQLAAAQLPLRSLALSPSRVGDAGAAYFAGFPQLTYLNISETRITDAGLSSLQNMRHLETLYADSLPLTDRSCTILRGLKQLTRLSLRKSRITDRGVEQLAHLSNLQELYLQGTEVTDRGLEALARQPRILKVGYSEHMSPTAIKKFEQHHPRPRWM